MRRARIMAAAATFTVSALPLSELYAVCEYTATAGGSEIRYCDNGTCWSRSYWSSDNRLIAVIEIGCA